MASERGQTEICSFLLQVEEQVAATSGHSPAQFCKNPVVNALIEYYYGMAQTQGTEFQVRLDLPDQMPLTDVELCTVLGNLLDNAIKYTSTGGITVSVYTYELFARIDITDTGIGIDEEEFPKIFQRFYRSGQVQDESGVGIGLYLSREILSGENGYIKVSSVPGKGSVFSVYLPLS